MLSKVEYILSLLLASFLGFVTGGIVQSEIIVQPFFIRPPRVWDWVDVSLILLMTLLSLVVVSVRFYQGMKRQSR